MLSLTKSQNIANGLGALEVSSPTSHTGLHVHEVSVNKYISIFLFLLEQPFQDTASNATALIAFAGVIGNKTAAFWSL